MVGRCTVGAACQRSGAPGMMAAVGDRLLFDGETDQGSASADCTQIVPGLRAWAAAGTKQGLC